MDTNDTAILNHIQAVFLTQSEDWWQQLPPEIKLSVNKSLKQSQKGETISHADAMKPYKKWLKK
ncbi:MAG: hypothetical protein IT236_04950 [Bacteroidia bacterium]|nr:hypothetical protein [Bacteroidia bacterium]